MKINITMNHIKMTQKQISKDNRIYWNDKIEKKFDEKKEAIESRFRNEIQENADKQYPKFLKTLGLEKDIAKLEATQKAYNDFVENKSKTENKLWFALCGAYNTIEKKWEKWSNARRWVKTMPCIDDAKGGLLVQELHQKLKENC